MGRPNWSCLRDWYQWEGGEDGERVWEGEYKCKYCVHMYVNGKIISAETILGMGGRKKENDSGSEFKYDIFVIL
jgi:hypothetical protein